MSGVEGTDPRTTDTGKLLARLAMAAGFDGDSGKWLLLAGALPVESQGWQRQFTAALWQSFQQSAGSAAEWLDASATHVGRSGKAALAHGLVAAALSSADADRWRGELERILDRLSPDERLRLMQDLIVRSAAGDAPKDAVLDYLEISRHAKGSLDPVEWLNLLVMASMLLADGNHSVTRKAAHEIGEALVHPASSGSDSVWAGLLAEGRRHLADSKTQHGHELEELCQSHRQQLDQERREKEQLSRRVDGLRAQIAEGREVSRMDILEDILLVTAETLQSLHRQKDDPEVALQNVKASLSLALGAGGAAEFGSIGEIVSYDPRLHQADGPANAGDAVRITLPGAVMKGNLTSSRVLKQAQVTRSSEND